MQAVKQFLQNQEVDILWFSINQQPCFKSFTLSGVNTLNTLCWYKISCTIYKYLIVQRDSTMSLTFYILNSAFTQQGKSRSKSTYKPLNN